MRRADVIKQIRKIAKSKALELTLVEGGGHTKAMFHDKFVVTIPRHNEINELTAKGLLKDAENWTED